jgi:TIR domain
MSGLASSALAGPPSGAVASAVNCPLEIDARTRGTGPVVARTQPTASDFFISYTKANRGWAEWIALQVEAAGFTTVMQAWDLRPGRDWTHAMHDAMANSRRTVAVLSPERLHREASSP